MAEAEAKMIALADSAYSEEFNTAFDSDRWDLSVEPYASRLTHGGCRIVWGFSTFGDSPIKAEVKRAFLSFSKLKADSTADRHHTHIKHIGRFASEDLAGCGSLLDLTEREAMAAYAAYLNRKGLEPVKLRNGKVRRSDELVFFHKVYVAIAFGEEAPDLPDLMRLDTWQTGKMPMRVVPHRQPPSRKPPAILFSNIPQDEIAADCKRHALFSLRTLCVSSVASATANLARFFTYVAETRPEISRTAELDRNCVLGFMAWVNGGGCAPSTGNTTISALRCFLDDIVLLGMDAPAQKIVRDEDTFKVCDKEPEFFSRGEQRRLLEHLGELEQPWRWMLTVHYQVGMRGSELCALTEKCLKATITGGWYLEYFQHKTKKFNSVPVTDEVASAIASALASSKAAYGEDCPYVFASGNREPILVRTYGNRLEKYIKRFRILADDGTLLDVRTHKFRYTVATNLINNPGIGGDASLVRMMLGQSGLGQLERYAAIHSETMIKCLAPITARDEEFIANLGKKPKISAETEKLGSPLCNGSCMRPAESGPCANYNACYGCPMFKPSKDSLDIFEYQLDEVEKRIAISEANGQLRSLELHRNTKDQLEKIIEKVKSA